MLENKSETQDEVCLYQTRIEEIKTKATQVEVDDLNCKKTRRKYWNMGRKLKISMKYQI